MKALQTKNNRAVLYLRYSTDKQKEESIEYQRAECEKFCELNGYEIIDEYVDRAHTACNSNRKNYIRLLKDAYNNPLWDIVIVYSFSRIFRNLKEALTQEALLATKGIQLLSVKEHFDDTMEGTLMRVVQHYVDAKQPQKCAEHTHSRLKQKALKSDLYEYFLVKNILSENILVNTVGTPIAHKGGGNSWEEIDSKKHLTMVKRMVALTATMHACSKGSLSGLPDQINTVTVSNPTLEMITYSGNSTDGQTGRDELKTSDGAM